MIETDTQIMEPDNWTKILGALNDSRYPWRTIEGIVNQTGVSEAIVKAELEEHQQETIKSLRYTQDGKDVYATIERYKKSATLYEKIKMGILNKAEYIELK